MLEKAFTIHIQSPQGIRGIHPLTIAIRTNLALHDVMNEMAYEDQVFIRCGSMTAGKAANSIPEESYLKGILLTAAPTAEEACCKRIKEIAESTAVAFRASAEVTWERR